MPVWIETVDTTEGKYATCYTHRSDGFAIRVHNEILHGNWSFTVVNYSGRFAEEYKSGLTFESLEEAKAVALTERAFGETKERIGDSVYLLSLPDGITPGKYEAAITFAEIIDVLKGRHPEKQFQFIPLDRNERGKLLDMLAIVS